MLKIPPGDGAGWRSSWRFQPQEAVKMADKKHAKPHPGHSKHLCALIGGGSGYTVVKPLVKNPKYICAKCGRAARSKSNLCAGRKL